MSTLSFFACSCLRSIQVVSSLQGPAIFASSLNPSPVSVHGASQWREHFLPGVNFSHRHRIRTSFSASSETKLRSQRIRHVVYDLFIQGPGNYAILAERRIGDAILDDVETIIK
jgi:hypothetical protein